MENLLHNYRNCETVKTLCSKMVSYLFFKWYEKFQHILKLFKEKATELAQKYSNKLSKCHKVKELISTSLARQLLYVTAYSLCLKKIAEF